MMKEIRWCDVDFELAAGLIKIIVNRHKILLTMYVHLIYYRFLLYYFKQFFQLILHDYIREFTLLM